MVRNKRAAPSAPAPAAAPPLVRTLPWAADRRKARAPPPPTAMPTSVEKAGGVLPPPAGQTETRFCLGPYERRSGGAAPDAADGGSLGVESEGSSTDVGVCLDDSASDVSQDSLVTSDSAVSSPPARRVGRVSPGAASTSSGAAGGQREAGSPMSGQVKKTQNVHVSLAPSPKETKKAQVISVGSATVKGITTKTSSVQVASTSPAPPKAVSRIDLNTPAVPTGESSSTVVASRASSQVVSVNSEKAERASGNRTTPETVQCEKKTSQTISVSSSSRKQNSPSPNNSRASPKSTSTVFLSLEQPSGFATPEARKSTSPNSTPSPAPIEKASLGRTSSVFLSPSQSDSEATPSRSVSQAVPRENQPLPKSPESKSPKAPSAQQTPRKAKAPLPPPKPRAPSPATSPSPSPASPTSPGPQPSTPSPLQSPTPASLRQLQTPAPSPPPPPAVHTRTFTERQRPPPSVPMPPPPRHGFQFHLQEAVDGEDDPGVPAEDGFAGVRDYLSPTAAIHSSRGTVRGVKDRVRAGIATFLQDNSTAKTLKSREQGRLVVYVTSMGIVRPTFQRCRRVRQILRQLMAEFEERDLFLSEDHQRELWRRLGGQRVTPPQVFIDGNLLGGAEAVERLNESGELRRMLKPFKMAGPPSSCGKCGGFRMLPCTTCNGSKKSCHRNHFTEQWVILRCGACDQSGLIRCDLCCS